MGRKRNRKPRVETSGIIYRAFVPKNDCEYHDEFLCGFCDGSEERQATCKRLKIKGLVKSLNGGQEQPDDSLCIAKKQAHEHWRYIESVLFAHGTDETTVELVGFHYRTAMEHGFKHGVEYAGAKNG